MTAKSIATSLAACFLLAHAAAASTIIQSSGDSEASEPLGYYAPYASSGITPIVYAVEWTQTSTYDNVDVFANLFTSGGNGTVDYSLVTAIGPGTTFAADGIVHGSVTAPANPTDVQLFQLPSLGPGTYFLVLDSPTPNTSWDYNFPIQGSYAAASGVTFLGDDWSAGASIDTSYTPGSTFSGTTLPVEFLITGTLATPEPATFGLIGGALMGIGIVLSRCRAANPRRAVQNLLTKMR